MTNYSNTNIYYDKNSNYNEAFRMGMTSKQIERIMLHMFFIKQMTAETIIGKMGGTNLTLAELIDDNNRLRCFVTFHFFRLWSKINGALVLGILGTLLVCYVLIAGMMWDREANIVQLLLKALKVFGIIFGTIGLATGVVRVVYLLWKKFLSWI